MKARISKALPPSLDLCCASGHSSSKLSRRTHSPGSAPPRPPLKTNVPQPGPKPNRPRPTHQLPPRPTTIPPPPLPKPKHISAPAPPQIPNPPGWLVATYPDGSSPQPSLPISHPPSLPYPPVLPPPPALPPPSTPPLQPPLYLSPLTSSGLHTRRRLAASPGRQRRRATARRARHAARSTLRKLPRRVPSNSSMEFEIRQFWSRLCTSASPLVACPRRNQQPLLGGSNTLSGRRIRLFGGPISFSSANGFVERGACTPRRTAKLRQSVYQPLQSGSAATTL